jgi:DNA-binding winged helix-turn-helix (wHTH) protein
MELLLILIERSGQLVNRAEILEKIWGKDVFLDADSAVSTAVRKLRRALRDDASAPACLRCFGSRRTAVGGNRAFR